MLQQAAKSPKLPIFLTLALDLSDLMKQFLFRLIVQRYLFQRRRMYFKHAFSWTLQYLVMLLHYF